MATILTPVLKSCAAEANLAVLLFNDVVVILDSYFGFHR